MKTGIYEVELVVVGGSNANSNQVSISNVPNQKTKSFFVISTPYNGK